MSIFVNSGDKAKFPSLHSKMAGRASKHNTFLLRNVTGVWPTDLVTIMGIFKFISDNKENFMNLNEAVGRVNRTNQRGNVSKSVDMKVLKLALLAAERGAEHITQRLTVDRKIILLTINTPGLKQYARSDQGIPAEELPRGNANSAKHWGFPPEGEIVKKENFGVRSARLMEKVIAAHMSIALSDIIVSLKDLGMNPVIFSNEALNLAVATPEKFYKPGEDGDDGYNWVLKNYLSTERRHWDQFKWDKLVADREKSLHVCYPRKVGVVAQNPDLTEIKDSQKYSMHTLLEIFPYYLRLRFRVHESEVLILRKLRP